MHFGSYFSSLLLHAALFAAVLFWPTAPRVDLNRPMMQISLTMGAPGGDKIATSVLGHQGKILSAQPEAQPLKTGQSAPLPENLLPQPEPLRTDAAPAPRAPAAEMPRPESRVETKPAPAPHPEVEKLPEVSPVKKTEQAKPQPEPKVEEKKTATRPKAEMRPDKEPEKTAPRPSGRDALRSALASAQKEAGPQRSPTRLAGSPVAGALAALQKEAKGVGTGGGASEGEGPGGGGLNNAYAGQVILAVKPNWSMATYGRDQLVALVRVRLDPQGNVLDASLERGSGRADFDSSAVNAVIRTQKLPKPPAPEQQELILTFNSLELAGGR